MRSPLASRLSPDDTGCNAIQSDDNSTSQGPNDAACSAAACSPRCAGAPATGHWWCPAGSAGFVYRQGLAGYRLSAMRAEQPDKRQRRSRVPGTLFLRHSLAVAELHVRLIEGERVERFELLELTAEPSCHRLYSGLGGQRGVLKPDSFVRLGLGPYEDSSFIEVDRGTEGSRALDTQLARYLAYAASGQEQAEHSVLPKTLWLANTAERAEVIVDCIERLVPSDQALFAVAQFDQAVDVLTTT